jgi:hypothetical protein
VTWSPVNLPSPDYHCPEHFGEIRFSWLWQYFSLSTWFSGDVKICLSTTFYTFGSNLNGTVFLFRFIAWYIFKASGEDLECMTYLLLTWVRPEHSPSGLAYK